MGESNCTIEEFHRRLREELAATSHPSPEQVLAVARRLAQEMQFSPELVEECIDQARTLMAEERH